MSYFEESVEVISVPGSIAVTSANCSRFVTLTSTGTFALAGANARPIGVITTNQPINVAGRVVFAGTVPVQAGGAIAVGDLIASGADGVAVVSTGTGSVPIGIARTAAASGQPVAVQLRLPGLAAAT